MIKIQAAPSEKGSNNIPYLDKKNIYVQNTLLTWNQYSDEQDLSIFIFSFCY